MVRGAQGHLVKVQYAGGEAGSVAGDGAARYLLHHFHAPAQSYTAHQRARNQCAMTCTAVRRANTQGPCTLALPLQSGRCRREDSETLRSCSRLGTSIMYGTGHTLPETSTFVRTNAVRLKKFAPQELLVVVPCMH